MIQLQEKQRKLSDGRRDLDARIEAMKTASPEELAAFKTEELPRRQSELKTLFDDVQSDAEMIRYQDQNRASMKADDGVNRMGMLGGGGAPVDARSLGQRFVESGEYINRSSDLKMRPLEAKFEGVKSWQGGDEDALKAVFNNTTGYVPFLPRTGRVVPLGQIQPVIADQIPQTPTDVPGGRYMEETTYTNNAGIVPEGTTKPEAALAFTERIFGMTKVAVTLPVTDEQLADVPQIRGIIDNRLSLMIRQKEDGFLLNNIAANGFDGFLVKTGVQNVPLAGDPLPTAVLRAMTQIEFDPGFAMVTALIMNPLDWQGYVTYQISTGAYLVGSPDRAAIEQMWGMPIIRTNRMPQGTALLGDFRSYSEILRREELTIRAGYINTDFVDNIQRILAEERFTLNIYRATAFAKVTDIVF